MQKLEIQANCLEEAKLKAFEQGITVVQDATNKWKREGSPILTKDISIFAANFLNDKGMFDFKGAGIIISVNPGNADTRKCPYKINNICRKGRCKLIRVIEIRSERDDSVLGTANTKAEAINLAKQIIKKYRDNVYGKTRYESEDIDFVLEYNPSIRAKLGQYIVFGVDEADVKLNKRKNRGFE